uniref:Derlin n=1 Tax=Fibrocapsa japonica TaxID=94617 RepID=A0A7S2XX42_9STRA|mmetsp:Transcript_21184/g.30718  ORF Transcript_21184/g.30718 Transcript_21184/m.30718 type:complete len:269 (+) Transcript_21184:69-875(+)|eukprot:CAMPEP_0113943112 /NCGR_PEP_ID=MMETSP1339-20121228/19185_1 /TAXON_ID=94617 /ORGANISM="Fibrocapsa japonica" /LENGTH=268 /DNA_ID=CAMNT_0000947885 /DNA_START=57 /DNA_END=863 /DNA_ORIENTATION=- /assembly_acc=CAM_ASM_000762
MNRIGRVGQGGSPQDWYNSVPFITKVWLTSTLAVTLAVNFGILPAGHLFLNFPLIWKKFQFWRLLTNFTCMGKLGFGTLITFYMLYSYSEKYETGGCFNTGGGGGVSDYAFMMMFGMVVMNIIGYFMNTPFMAQPLVFFVMYVWSRRFPDLTVSFMFGVKIQSIYAPWAYVAFQILLGNSPFMALLGIAVGHLYYFLAEIVPDQYDFEILKTPVFMIHYFGYGAYHPVNTAPAAQRGSVNGTGGQPANSSFPMPGGRQWGQGHVLGTN